MAKKKPKRRAFLIGQVEKWPWQTTKGGRWYRDYYIMMEGGWTTLFDVGTQSYRYQPGAIVIAEYKPWPVGKGYAPSKGLYWQIVKE